MRPRSRNTHTHMRMAALLAAMLLAVVLAACGSSASIRIELAPTAAVLNVGGSVSVTLSVASATAAGPFLLEASGLPSGVDAVFSAPTVSNAGDSRQMTLTASPTATEGTFTVTVSAAGALATGTATLELTVELLEVSGVVSTVLGVPLAGVNVVIAGHGGTTTALDGSFSLEDVVVPYTISVIHPGEGWAHIYEGVSIGDLDIAPLTSVMGTVPTAKGTVQGTVTPEVGPLQNLIICAEGIDVEVFGCATLSTGQSSYNIPVNWSGASTANIRLRAVRYDLNADNNPLSISGSGAVEQFTLSEGGTETKDITIGAPVGSLNFNANVLSPHFTPTNVDIGLQTVLPSGHVLIAPGAKSATGSGVSLVAPSYTGATYNLLVQASSLNGQGALVFRPGLLTAGNYEVSLPAPSSAAGPASDATGIGLDTTFSVSGTPGRMNMFLFGVGSVNVAISTMASEAKIPDLSAYGMGIGSSVLGNWNVLNSPDFTDVNSEVSGGVGLSRTYVSLIVGVSGGPTHDQDYRAATSGHRTFTTAP
ncbi:MAG: hypothetical protein KF813_09230 [Trueperaceae bacterium]|nr:hypothetical protein [Trueperaceae bacterium]